MDRIANLFIGVLVTVVSGCGSVPSERPREARNSAANVHQTANEAYMTPVPLYGKSGLSLGVRQQAPNFWQLELCDRKQRVINADKPLVLYLNGQLAYLKNQWVDKPAAGCFYYKISAEQLHMVSHYEHVLLRAFFSREVVEQRVSGTVSDYFTRPKYYGPQQSLKRFIDSRSKIVSANRLRGG